MWAAVVGAFVLFAAVLGWGDYRSQTLARRIRDRDRKDAVLAASAMALKNMALKNMALKKMASKKMASNKTDYSAAVPAAAQARSPQPSDDRLQHVA